MMKWWRSIFSPPFHKFPSLSSSFSSCRRAPFPPPPQNPPIPKKIPFAASAHGRTWADPYRWMSNTDDPDLLDHLGRENSYAEAFMTDTFGLRRRLVAEMRSRMPPSISTPPESWGPWFYYQYIPEGKEYPIFCRRMKSQNGFAKARLNYMKEVGEEEILLDWNEIMDQFGYVHIGMCRISPNHKLLAYTLDTAGSEIFMLQVKDLRTGHVISNSRIKGVVSLAWSRDSRYLLYTVCDDTQRPYRVFYTELGSNAADDLLFTENDLNCCVDITSTKDGKFITINSNSRTSSEVYVIDATNLKDGLWPVRKRVAGVQYFVEHHYGFFYILTNAPPGSMQSVTGEYHLVRCRAEKSLLTRWQVAVVPGQDITFQDMDIFHGHLVFFLQKENLPLLCSINMPIDFNNEPIYIQDLDPWFFPLPSSLCNIVPGSNHEFVSSVYRVVISSPVMPNVIVDYDMAQQKFSVLHQEEVLGLNKISEGNRYAEKSCTGMPQNKPYDDRLLRSVEESQMWGDLSEAFSCKRSEVISHDGVAVPLTIIYSRRNQLTGQSPGILHGYGAYGEVLDKSWCSDHISLLTRGWVLAYADVRGGGGDASWHKDGTRSQKLNSIYDFAACGMYLVNEGYVHNNRLGAIGCSAGGLLVASTINMYPDLFSAAILKVPFVDICNTMLDPSLPLTTTDYEEFGDPRIQTEFETIHSYSPYENIRPGVCYPSVLVTAAFHDSRVGVWEAAKWVARIRESTCPACSQSVILKTDMRGGHLCESGRFLHCEDTSFDYAFLIKAMGMLNDEKQFKE